MSACELTTGSEWDTGGGLGANRSQVKPAPPLAHGRALKQAKPMGRKRNRDVAPETNWDTERTMAAAEEEAAAEQGLEAAAEQGLEAEGVPDASTQCLCGARQMVLQAYLGVEDGKVKLPPVR